MIKACDENREQQQPDLWHIMYSRAASGYRGPRHDAYRRRLQKTKNFSSFYLQSVHATFGIHDACCEKHCMHTCSACTYACSKQSDQVTTECTTRQGDRGCLDAVVADAAIAAVSLASSLLAFSLQASDQSKPVDEFQVKTRPSTPATTVTCNVCANGHRGNSRALAYQQTSTTRVTVPTTAPTQSG